MLGIILDAGGFDFYKRQIGKVSPDPLFDPAAFSIEHPARARKVDLICCLGTGNEVALHRFWRVWQVLPIAGSHSGSKSSNRW